MTRISQHCQKGVMGHNILGECLLSLCAHETSEFPHASEGMGKEKALMVVPDIWEVRFK